MQPDLQRLDDILVAIDDARYAILHSLTIIGEAANRLSEEFRMGHPQVPWRRITAFRHRVVHGYGELDLQLVWDVARLLVPGIRSQVAAIRDGLEFSGPL